MIQKQVLENLYYKEKMSMRAIAVELQCSANRVAYWMNEYNIKRRSVSEAIYQIHNPLGDPFKVKPIRNKEDANLQGIGLGLYWGEGNKKNKHSVRLGNTNPVIIEVFIRFLVDLYGVNKDKLHFGLQLFSDCIPEEALSFWQNRLGVKASQFYKVTVTISGSIGTYRHKNKYGVLTVYFHNKKLRDVLVGALPT